MCGRFASTLPPEMMAKLFRTTGALPNQGPNWNMAPTQGAMVVRRHPETCERRLDVLQWGLIPHFTKDLKTARKPINARSETAGTSGMFRGALASRRTIVPCEAFYEWKAMADGKQPYAIARRDGAQLAFAGVWEGWRSPEGETVRTFAIMTTAANSTMSVLHDRMPVVLEEVDWPVWLGEEEGDSKVLLRPAADDVLRLWPVSRGVNSVRTTVPRCWMRSMTRRHRRRAMHLLVRTRRDRHQREAVTIQITGKPTARRDWDYAQKARLVTSPCKRPRRQPPI